METKKCGGRRISCGQVKPISEFNQKQAACKSCQSEYKKQYREENKEIISANKKQFYERNKENINAQKKEYYQKNKDQISKQKKEYRKNNKEKEQLRAKQYYINNKDKVKKYQLENKIKIKEQKAQYKSENRDKINEYDRQYRKERKQNDPTFKFHLLASDRVRKELKSHGYSKNEQSIKNFLPQSAYEVLEYLQILFALPSNLTPDGKVWMTMNNWGQYNAKTWDDNDPSTWTWQLDHINPHSNFIYSSMDSQEFRECWDKTNLRPLLAKQNIIENDNRTLEQISAIKEEIRIFLDQAIE